MKRIKVIAIIAGLLSCYSFAQLPESNSFRSQLVLNHSAEVLPNLCLAMDVGKSMLPTRNNFFRANIAIGLSNVIELGLSNPEAFIDAFAATQPVWSWSLELKILSQQDDQPNIALRVQTSAGWTFDELIAGEIQAHSAMLYHAGLWNSHYDLDLTTAELLITHQLSRGIALHASFGVQEIQTRDLWIIVSPAPFIGNGFHASGVTQQLLLSGSLSLAIPLVPKVTLLSEVQSIPAVSPNIELVKLTVERAYFGSIAARYLLSQALGLEAGLLIQHNPYSRNNVQVRVGLNSLFTLR
jgi:hypothetical protein